MELSIWILLGAVVVSGLACAWALWKDSREEHPYGGLAAALVFVVAAGFGLLCLLTLIVLWIVGAVA